MNKEKHSTFGEALEQAIEIKRFSQRELASIMGVHESQISNWSKNVNTPYPKTQKKINKALRVNISKDGNEWAVETENSGIVQLNGTKKIVDNIFDTYGEALKYARKEIGIKQGVFAKKIGSFQSEVSKWENTSREPLDHTKRKINEALGINISKNGDYWIVETESSGSLQANNITDLNIPFTSYGEAIAHVLKNRGLSKKWLATRIKDKDAELASMQSQVSRWITGKPVSEIYRQRIDNSLDISIVQHSNGKWILNSEENDHSLSTTNTKDTYEDRVNRLDLYIEEVLSVAKRYKEYRGSDLDSEILNDAFIGIEKILKDEASRLR